MSTYEVGWDISDKHSVYTKIPCLLFFGIYFIAIRIQAYVNPLAKIHKKLYLYKHILKYLENLVLL